jgi:hypothetical protein
MGQIDNKIDNSVLQMSSVRLFNSFITYKYCGSLIEIQFLCCWCCVIKSTLIIVLFCFVNQCEW